MGRADLDTQAPPAPTNIGVLSADASTRTVSFGPGEGGDDPLLPDWSNGTGIDDGVLQYRWRRTDADWVAWRSGDDAFTAEIPHSDPYDIIDFQVRLVDNAGNASAVTTTWFEVPNSPVSSVFYSGPIATAAYVGPEEAIVCAVVCPAAVVSAPEVAGAVVLVAGAYEIGFHLGRKLMWKGRKVRPGETLTPTPRVWRPPTIPYIAAEHRADFDQYKRDGQGGRLGAPLKRRATRAKSTPRTRTTTSTTI